MNWFTAPVLTGSRVTLRPLALSDASELCAAVDRPEAYGWTTVPSDADGATRYIQTALDTPDRVAFAVVDNDSGHIVGSTSFYDITPGELDPGDRPHLVFDRGPGHHGQPRSQTPAAAAGIRTTRCGPRRVAHRRAKCPVPRRDRQAGSRPSRDYSANTGHFPVRRNRHLTTALGPPCGAPRRNMR